MNNNIVLPNFLNPRKFQDLIRIGKDNDGGYIVRSQDIEDTRNLISLGISFDFSFEEDFLKKNKKVNISSFDGSVGFKYYRKRCKYRTKYFLLNPRKKNFLNIVDGIKDLLNFSKFYRFNLFSNVKHTEKFVSLDISMFKEFEKNYGYKPEIIEFDEIISSNLNQIYFSIDIEGQEYDLLDDLCRFSNKITGLNIEFHNVDKNLKTIESFIKKFDLLLIHTHINNFGKIIDGIPSVIELTFSNNFEKVNSNNYELTNYLPIALDQPNNIEGEDYSVTFK